MTTGEQTARALGFFSLGLGTAQVVAPGPVARLVGMHPNRATSIVLRAFGVREIIAGVGILGQQRPAQWLWARVAGDMLDLAVLTAALVTNGQRRPRLLGALATVAGITALDLQTAEQLTGGRPDSGLRIVRGITVNRSREDVQTFWQDFAQRTDVATDLQSAQFAPAPGNRGTEIRVDVEHDQPASALLAAIKRTTGSNPAQRVEADLRRAKQLLEAGEITVSDATRDGAHLFQDAAQPLAGSKA